MTKRDMTPLERLRCHLRLTDAGPITDTRTLEVPLASAWAELAGGSAHGMKERKLFGRIENVVWAPPCLTFVIERHGGTVCGSTRGELQGWAVNVESGTAEAGEFGYRQLYPKQPPLRIEPLVNQTLTLIEGRQAHEWLKWLPDGRLRVLVAKVIPTEIKQTTAGRRKRFRVALESRLAAIGLRQAPGKAPYTYEPIPWSERSRRAGRRGPLGALR